jgi:hypothetical protein
MNDRAQRMWAAVRRHRYETAFVASIVAALVIVSIGLGVSRPAVSDTPVAQAPVTSPTAIASLPRSTPSPSPVKSSPSPAVSSLAPSPEPSPTASDLIDQEPAPIDEEEGNYPTPEPDPSVALRVGGMGGDAGYYIQEGDSVEDVLHLITRDLTRSKCSLTQSYEPDDPAVSPWKKQLEPLREQTVNLTDGWHTFAASCPSSAGVLKASVRAIAMDGHPEQCLGFEFVRDDISVSSFEELTTGIVGTWEGCVTTPWTPMFAVAVELDENGTFSATTDEVLDGNRMMAMYYGSDSTAKTYQVNDFQASHLGIGQIDGSDGRFELRNIRLMGDKFEFEVFSGDYGPITYRLTRATDSP